MMPRQSQLKLLSLFKKLLHDYLADSISLSFIWQMRYSDFNNELNHDG
jgi:hypothetical protein